MIAIVTDSASMIPPGWRDRDGVFVAPMTVVIDGIPYREGVDITSAEFYDHLTSGATVSTSTPSPGEVLAVYQAALDAGCNAIVSVHTGSEFSAVLGAARVAAGEIPVPVELVDSATVSFPVALCVASACETRRSGAPPADVAGAARATAAAVDSIFVIGAPDLARRGGRFSPTVGTPTELTVLGLGAAGLVDLGTASSVDDALERMARAVRAAARDTDLRVGVGDANRSDLGQRLAAAIRGAPGITELVRYEVGPSVGAHSGAGTVGAVWAPTVPVPRSTPG